MHEKKPGVPWQVAGQATQLMAAASDALRLNQQLTLAGIATAKADKAAFQHISDAYAASLTVSHTINNLLLAFEREDA